MTTVRVVVQSDDFGMCHAGNEGVVRSFTDGILTQASVMVPCPWFGEAARLAREHAIPVGPHLTLTSEWAYLRWGPLTGGRSLVAADGRFPRTIEAAQAKADRGEVIAEFVAQVEAFGAEGLEITYFDCHMGLVIPDTYAEICRRYGRPFDYPIGEEAVGFDSIHMLSSKPSEEKVGYLVGLFGRLEPGTHLVVAHCAVDSDELRAMTDPEAENAAWANEYRVSDLAALTHPDVIDAAKAVELVSVADLTSR